MKERNKNFCLRNTKNVSFRNKSETATHFEKTVSERKRDGNALKRFIPNPGANSLTGALVWSGPAKNFTEHVRTDQTNEKGNENEYVARTCE